MIYYGITKIERFDMKVYSIRTITPIVEEGEGETVLAVRVWDRVPDTVEISFPTRDEALYFHKVVFANECVELD